MLKNFLTGQSRFWVVFWITFFLPIVLSQAGFYSIYGLGWGVMMPGLLYNTYLAGLIALYFFGAYIGSYAVIRSIFKQKPPRSVRYLALISAVLAILYLPARLVLSAFL